MLKRLYVNGFRTLVNFDAEFGPMNLFLGPNGGGKSSVFDVLHKLRAYVAEGKAVEECFPFADFTDWAASERCDQVFELVIEGNGGVYCYKLTIEYTRDRRKPLRMGRESLTFDGEPLFGYEAEEGSAQLYHDDHTTGPEIPLDWTRSGVGFLHARPDNTKLTWFKERLGRVVVVRPNPAVMGAESREEEESLSPDLSNFASWYRYLSQEYQGQVFKLTTTLREVLPGYDSFRLAALGEAKVLSVGFRKPSGGVAFQKLDSLSDGQRVLIVLYSLLHCLPAESVTLCVDEPENFLALPEIQPWLDEVDEGALKGERQVLLISHHPKLINFLARDAGVWLSREAGVGPTRPQRLAAADDDSGLPLSQLVERGWILDV